MKLLKTIMKGDKAIHTVEMAPGEKLLAIQPDAYYELGDPLGEIVPGHIIENAELAMWCPVEQKWVT